MGEGVGSVGPVQQPDLPKQSLPEQLLVGFIKTKDMSHTIYQVNSSVKANIESSPTSSLNILKTLNSSKGDLTRSISKGSLDSRRSLNLADGIILDLGPQMAELKNIEEALDQTVSDSQTSPSQLKNALKGYLKLLEHSKEEVNSPVVMEKHTQLETKIQHTLDKLVFEETERGLGRIQKSLAELPEIESSSLEKLLEGYSKFLDELKTNASGNSVLTQKIDDLKGQIKLSQKLAEPDFLSMIKSSLMNSINKVLKTKTEDLLTESTEGPHLYQFVRDLIGGATFKIQDGNLESSSKSMKDFTKQTFTKKLTETFRKKDFDAELKTRKALVEENAAIIQKHIRPGDEKWGPILQALSTQSTLNGMLLPLKFASTEFFGTNAEGDLRSLQTGGTPQIALTIQRNKEGAIVEVKAEVNPKLSLYAGNIQERADVMQVACSYKVSFKGDDLIITGYQTKLIF